jgi:ferrous iron transport protein B
MRTIAVAGNPNAGKTTLFNALAGTRHHVANYPGVTVERIEATRRLCGGEKVLFLDLPGCYSLTARSPEEQVAHDVVLGRILEGDQPSLVLCVLDTSNIERNLFLATQLRDLGLPMAIILNMVDVAEQKGIRVNPDRLSKILACPVIKTVAREGVGIDQVMRLVESPLQFDKSWEKTFPRFIDQLPPEIEHPVNRLAARLAESKIIPGCLDLRFEALWALQANIDGDDPVEMPTIEAVQVREVLREYNLSRDSFGKITSEARYAYIQKIIESARIHQEDRPNPLNEKLDALLLHPTLGPVIFFMVFSVVFQSIFAGATPFMDGIDWIFNLLTRSVSASLPDSHFKELVVGGILAGVGNTLVFLPQILILFFFLAILEESGYLARAAFLLDRWMSSVGLDGKAFIPLLSCFACAIPGIMATRTIPNRKDRLVTILVAPLVACSARLPVYTLIIGTVFIAEKRVFGVFNQGGLVLLGIYLLGVFSAIAIAALFKRTLLKSPKPALILELPPYRLPSLRGISLILWDRCITFIKKVSTVILAITILLWALFSFPRNAITEQTFQQNLKVVETNLSLSDVERTQQVHELETTLGQERIQNSFGARFGHFIEPVIQPLGFDWKIGVGLIASFAAREVFVSTLGVIYGVSADTGEDSLSLREALRAERRAGTNLPFYTPLVGLSLLVFYVFACQCMATLAIVRKETQTWRWPAFMLIYMTILAWVASFLVYQTGLWIGYQ